MRVCENGLTAVFGEVVQQALSNVYSSAICAPLFVWQVHIDVPFVDLQTTAEYLFKIVRFH